MNEFIGLDWFEGTNFITPSMRNAIAGDISTMMDFYPKLKPYNIPDQPNNKIVLKGWVELQSPGDIEVPFPLEITLPDDFPKSAPLVKANFPSCLKYLCSLIINRDGTIATDKFIKWEPYQISLSAFVSHVVMFFSCNNIFPIESIYTLKDEFQPNEEPNQILGFDSILNKVMYYAESEIDRMNKENEEACRTERQNSLTESAIDICQRYKIKLEDEIKDYNSEVNIYEDSAQKFVADKVMQIEKNIENEVKEKAIQETIELLEIAKESKYIPSGYQTESIEKFLF